MAGDMIARLFLETRPLGILEGRVPATSALNGNGLLIYFY